MAGDAPRPLTTEEAKERLRAATRELGVQAWIHHSPWGFLALALGSGYLAGRMPAARSSMMWALARTMITLSGK